MKFRMRTKAQGPRECDEPLPKPRVTFRARAACLATVLLLFTGACARSVVSDVGVLASAARTPSDHGAVAAAYRERAQSLRREASHHAELAQQWSDAAGGRVVALMSERSASEGARHCRELFKTLSAAADGADALAELHESIARGEAPPGMRLDSTER